MNTEVLKVDPLNIDSNILQKAKALILKDQVVAFPTETVYGLGANAFSENAVKKIYLAKGRPSDNPMIVHISSMKMLEKIVKHIPDNITQICKAFWPGPLTILFEKNKLIPDVVTSGLVTVAIRMPSHPIAHKLIEISNVPIAAPSANLSGRPSPTTADHVYIDLNGRIPLILDGGSTTIGLESTVINMTNNPPVILRPGGYTFEKLQSLIPDLQVYNKGYKDLSLEISPPTPGLKYRHYAPQAQIILFEGDLQKNYMKIINFIEDQIQSGNKVGLIHTNSKVIYPALIHGDKHFLYYPLGNESHPEIIARGLFNAFRDLDKKAVDLIIFEGISEIGEGLAIMNRVRKAASKIITI